MCIRDRLQILQILRVGADCAIQQRLRHPTASVEQLPKAEYALLRGGCGISCESREGRLLTSLAWGVWHVLRAREGRLPTSLRRSGASYTQPPCRNRRRRATRSRRPDCPRRVRAAEAGDALRDSAEGRGSRGDSREGTAGNRGAGLVFEKSGMAPPATLSLTRAPRRPYDGRAAVARLPSHMPRRAI